MTADKILLATPSPLYRWRGRGLRNNRRSPCPGGRSIYASTLPSTIIPAHAPEAPRARPTGPRPTARLILAQERIRGVNLERLEPHPARARPILKLVYGRTGRALHAPAGGRRPRPDPRDCAKTRGKPAATARWHRRLHRMGDATPSAQRSESTLPVYIVFPAR